MPRSVCVHMYIQLTSMFIAKFPALCQPNTINNAGVVELVTE